MTRGRRALKECAEWALVAGTLAGLWLLVHGTGATVAMVRTESMEPAIYPGDIVIASPGTPRIGDIVVFTPVVVGERLPQFVHRLTGTKPDGSWATQGDNNDHPDSARTTDADIQGIVRQVLPTRFLRHPAAPAAGGAALGLLAGLTLYRSWRKRQEAADDSVPCADRTDGGETLPSPETT